jgi:hypothetical protein
MNNKSKYNKNNEKKPVTNDKFLDKNNETQVLVLEDELSSYPHCRLPNHYFDLLLSRHLFGQMSQSQVDFRENSPR